MNKMTVDVNMFGPFTEDGIFGNIQDDLTTTKRLHRLGMKDTKQGKESKNTPKEFTSCDYHNVVFHFS